MESVLHAKVDTRLSSLHSVLQDAEKHILPSSENVNAGYFKDGKLCWISNGSALSILKHGSPSITSFTDFASTYEGFSLKITCCKEFEDNLLVGM
uniref:Uncharacterized protein n=1 Tax=Ciona savignyi TaxID=51511 RepID=H2ZMT7_CIOSA